VDPGDTAYTILAIQCTGAGRIHAANALQEACLRYDIGVVVCVGIAGALSSDLRLGDVCYTGTVTDIFDNAKASDDEAQGIDLSFVPTLFSTDQTLSISFNFLRTQPDVSGNYRDWQESRQAFALELCGETLPGRGKIKEKVDLPRTLNGDIVCALVSKSPRFNKRLKDLNRKFLAIETESGAVFSVAETNRIPAITVRGISDYADENKTTLETNTSGSVRRLAAGNAAAFFQLQLHNPYVQAYVEKRRVQLSAGGASDSKEDKLTAMDAFHELASQIDSNLRQLSPALKLLTAHHHIPTPRIIQFEFRIRARPTAKREVPIDARDALKTRRRLYINVPRTFPDNSLPWVIARDLLTLELDGKQVIPVVVDGGMISPPRRTIENCSYSAFSQFSRENHQYVFIFDSVPLGSKTKIDFLLDQLSSYSDDHFIFVVREGKELKARNDFISTSGAENWNLARIPFLEIASFIKANFEMAAPEAEVAALKLSQAFKRFGLFAHPTYFAGIPPESLLALLQANRRVELIQLATDGFLTFLVADDRAVIQLSRTTRATFLQRLAVELNVEKISYTPATLVAAVAKFAKEFDFDIDELLWTSAFFEKGILLDDDGQVRFGLPFVEHYMLARALHGDVHLAKKYFRYELVQIDIATFDLYCEMGPSMEIIDNLIGPLREFVERVGSSKVGDGSGEGNILLTNEIRPKAIDHPIHFEGIRRRLTALTKEVQDGTGDVSEKQRVLHLVDGVSVESGARLRASEGNRTESGNANVGMSWVLGAVLLGSAAEHLEADKKREVIGVIIRSAAKLANAWTLEAKKVDFDGLRSEIFEQMKAQGKLGEFDGPEAEKKAVELFNVVFDFIEFFALSAPFGGLITYLCEQARHAVLFKSIDSIKIDDQLGELIRLVWSAEINSKASKRDLLRNIAKLPLAKFLRFILAGHFLTRVYWTQWEKEDRLVLLEAAEEVIRPIALHLDKGALRRIIEDESDLEGDGGKVSRS
jgi:nucleoside phosphorylase